MKNYSNYHNHSVLDKTLRDGKRIFEIVKRGISAYDAIIDGKINTKVIVEQAYNPYSEKKEERLIKCDMTVDIGIRSTVYLPENDDMYIVITEIDDNRVFKYFKVIRCNNTLKWQDKYLKIHEIPCYLSYATSLSSDGLLRGSDMIVANDQVTIIVPRYKHVLDIPLGKRLVFNHSKNSIFKYVRTDELSHNGVISLMLKVELYDNHVDDLVNNLANETPIDDSTATIPNQTIRIITNNKMVKKGGYEIISYDVLINDIPTNEPIKVIIDKPNIAQFVEILDDYKIVIKGLQFGDFILRVELANNSLVYIERAMKVSGI